MNQGSSKSAIGIVLHFCKFPSRCTSFLFLSESSRFDKTYPERKINYYLTDSLVKITCTNLADFGKSEHLFGRLFYAENEKNDTKYLKVQQKVLQKTIRWSFANTNKTWENHISNNFYSTDIKLLLLLRISRRMRTWKIL